MGNPKTVLICPLDWGLGHATRCVPIINKLKEFGFNIIIAADNRPFAFLKEEFPELKIIKFSGTKINYPKSNKMIFMMILLLPKLIYGIFKEHFYLKKLIKKLNVDIVISDNRFGLWNKKVKSIYITHQIFIKCPDNIKFLEKFLYLIHKSFIKKYDECWIPDFEDENNLSGDLSHKFKIPNSYFIGTLSRFNALNKDYIKKTTPHYKILAILSGPEPQRTILENIIIDELKNSNFKSVIVQGKTEQNYDEKINNNIKIITHLESKKLLEYILDSEIIICRSGYSSIMDLAVLGKKAIFIPTPGQTEQEYLANYFNNKNIFININQDKINISKALLNINNYSGLKINFNENLLLDRIKILV